MATQPVHEFIQRLFLQLERNSGDRSGCVASFRGLMIGVSDRSRSRHNALVFFPVLVLQDHGYYACTTILSGHRDSIDGTGRDSVDMSQVGHFGRRNILALPTRSIAGPVGKIPEIFLDPIEEVPGAHVLVTLFRDILDELCLGELGLVVVVNKEVLYLFAVCQCNQFAGFSWFAL